MEYEKAFEGIHRDMLWKVLERRGYTLQLLRVINNYDGTAIVIRTLRGKTDPMMVNSCLLYTSGAIQIKLHINLYIHIVV